MKLQYFIIYKPFGMLSQFSREGEHATLADLDYTFPKDVYPVGRLDADSEGLLFLTNDKELNHKLLNPKFAHWRTYLVQVEGTFTNEAKNLLEKGVDINVNGSIYKTLPSKVKLLDSIPAVPERIPPIRFRKNIPDSWIAVSLIEGKNRQVRKMTAKVGFPTLRLIRVAIGKLELGNLLSGEVKVLNNNDLDLLFKS